jgi:hypothetical protein
MMPYIPSPWVPVPMEYASGEESDEANMVVENPDTGERILATELLARLSSDADNN